jgi:antirestriction protein ArdC
MKQYNVFNESQLEDYQAEEGQGETFNRADVTKFIYNTSANIYHEGDKAYYRPSNDQIVLPVQEDFKNTEEASAEQNYYGTLFHELTHWTGNTNRLDRLKQKTSREDYAFEELIAELGATFLNVHFGIESTPRADHAKYLKAWLQALENDNGLIFRASAKAGQAFDYLEKLQDQEKQKKSA